jgi:hypothetical protein
MVAALVKYIFAVCQPYWEVLGIYERIEACIEASRHQTGFNTTEIFPAVLLPYLWSLSVQSQPLISNSVTHVYDRCHRVVNHSNKTFRRKDMPKTLTKLPSKLVKSIENKRIVVCIIKMCFNLN